MGPNGEDLVRGGAEPRLLIADLDKGRRPGNDVEPYLKDRRGELYERLLR